MTPTHRAPIGLPDTMLAAVLKAAGELSVEQVAVPRPDRGEVLLRITGAGVCGSDASFYTQGIEAFPPDRRGAWPVIPGHEFAGRVVALGDAVTSLRVGDHVACGAGVSCGQCQRCRNGRTNLCVAYQTLGAHRDGGLAEYCVAPASTCVEAGQFGAAGDDVALAQPMAVAHHAVARARTGRTDRVLVIGCGGVGAFAVWAARATGADVIATDLDESRLEIAARLGAHTVADPADLSSAGGSEQADVVLETSGAATALDLALSVAAPGARVVQLGLHGQSPTLPLKHMTLHEVDLLGTYAHVCGDDLPAALRLLGERAEGWADVAPQVLPLRDLVADALEPLAAGSAGQVKYLIGPHLDSVRPYSRQKDGSEERQ